jgi:hypothetical protein
MSKNLIIDQTKFIYRIGSRSSEFLPVNIPGEDVEAFLCLGPRVCFDAFMRQNYLFRILTTNQHFFHDPQKSPINNYLQIKY